MVEETKTEEATVSPTSTDVDLKAVEGVKERLKFFFSDANIRQDGFLRKLLMDSGEKAVGVDVLLRFNTIKKHTEKADVLIKAAKELTDSLVVNEETKLISRVVPFTKEMMKENIPKSLYVRNLPINESKKYDVKVDEIRDLFSKYGDVALVNLKFSGFSKESKDNHYGPASKKKRRKVPLGAAMVEFQTKDDLEKAAAATLTTKDGEKVDPTEKITLPTTETRKDAIDLDVMLLSEHVANCKEKNEKREGQKRSKPEPEGENETEPQELPKFVYDWKPGCVIRIRGLPEGCDREAILDSVGKAMDISPLEVKDRKIYVDYSRGQKDGAIRFPEPSDSVAETSKTFKEGDVKILDAKVEDAFVLEGEEEKKYWEDFIAFKTKQMIQRAEERKRGGNKRQKMGR